MITGTQRNFMSGRAYFDDGILKVRITEKQNPGIIKSTLSINALIDMPAGSGYFKAGTRINVFYYIHYAVIGIMDRFRPVLKRLAGSSMPANLPI